LIAKTMKRRFQLDTERLFLSLKKGLPLRYGENPHQKGWIYINEDERDTFLRTIKKLWGKELSYNNILDAYSAWKLLVELNSPACVIVKHNNPCGVAEGKTILEAYKKALEGDPISAFGGIVALSEEVNPELAFELNNIFLEIVMSPSFPDEVLSILKKKKNRRLLIIPLKKGREKLEFRWIDGDFLVEEEDSAILEKETIRIVSGELTKELLEELVFAYKVVKHVRSNAIVVTKDKGTLGIGAGQMNRLQAVKIALENAGKKAEGAVLASDRFFPFTDSVELAHQYGIKAIIQPGGSVRDEEVIKKTRELNIAMVVTGIRHFRH
ncbi:MAG TPA: bifunctional phosphoribosylaminoimidazolecarboxamide formyltransferase/IMP cyclohydrolase, partial [Candidatus Omnitrophica bacterium]|nr:bifunctional phosphoribosylaminoimidazolecarboxamide formyltransferase/IMP cyclohydrolase [Candidatus Omnitrophota bacterium]